jgi:catechol 2,3-dioxygenase-like lactoylglutathione lyase family enzyme
MLDIKRAGHSTLTTPDIERTLDHFTRIIGLSVAAREKNRVILATKSGLESIVLERGSEAGAPRLSLQITPGSDPGEVVSRLQKAGVKSERQSDITPGIKEAVVFTDPKGTVIEVFSDFDFAPRDDNFNGVMPLKLGHVAYTCPDVQSIVKFYCDVLGFRVSDWRGDFFAFLRCSRDHHTVNFLRDQKTGIHHIAFEVRDWTDVKRASDFLAQSNVHLTWGPLRHIIGHNIAIYHKNPDGVVIEFYCELDQMYDEQLGFFEPRPWHQDRPQRPKVWGDGTLSNWWGPMSHSPNRTHPNTPQEAEVPPQKTPASVAAAVRTEKKTRILRKSRPKRR